MIYHILLGFIGISAAFRFPFSSHRRNLLNVYVKIKSVDETPPPPPPTGSAGEWADWSGDSYLEDEYIEDDIVEEKGDNKEENKPIKLDSAFLAIPLSPKEEIILDEKLPESVPNSGRWSSSRGSEFGGRRDNFDENEEPPMLMNERWSEEAPYFDEADVQDDEGNWGRSTGDTPSSGSTTSWMTRAQYAENAELSSGISSNISPIPSSASTFTSMSDVSNNQAVITQTLPKITSTSLPLNDATKGTLMHPGEDLSLRIDKLEKMFIDVKISIALVQGFIVGAFVMYLANK